MHQLPTAGAYARRPAGVNMKSAFEPLEGEPKLASLTQSRARVDFYGVFAEPKALILVRFVIFSLALLANLIFEH